MPDSQHDCLDYVSTPVFALAVNDDGIPTYIAFNAYARDSSGLSLEDVLGKTAIEVYPGRGGQSAYERHLEVIKSRKPSEYEVSLSIAGEIRQIKTSLNPVLDANGRVIELVGTSLDITELKAGLESQAAVDTITTEMEDFITMAAHDLRTPMRNVQNIADMLRDDFEDLGDGKLDLVGLLEDVALKATSLITDVLAHAQATKARREMVLFDFGELCSEIQDILDPFGHHKIQFENFWITGDKTAYQIVLRNLLDNALKHGGENCLNVSISMSATYEDMIEIEVRDNGKGFADPGLAFLGGGKMRVDSGFGLLGVKRMIKARNGTITVSEPEIGSGSIVRFTLPGVIVERDKQETDVRVISAQ